MSDRNSFLDSPNLPFFVVAGVVLYFFKDQLFNKNSVSSAQPQSFADVQADFQGKLLRNEPIGVAQIGGPPREDTPGLINFSSPETQTNVQKLVDKFYPIPNSLISTSTPESKTLRGASGTTIGTKTIGLNANNPKINFSSSSSVSSSLVSIGGKTAQLTTTQSAPAQSSNLLKKAAANIASTAKTTITAGIKTATNLLSSITKKLKR